MFLNGQHFFVADAPNIVGLDQFPRLVDFLLALAGRVSPVSA